MNGDFEERVEPNKCAFAPFWLSENVMLVGSNYKYLAFIVMSFFFNLIIK